MKRTSLALFALLAVGAIAGISFNRTASADSTTQPSTAPSAKADNKLCPITKEPVDASVATYEYKGKTIGFCCSDCVKTFKENPDKYMADLK